MHHVEKPHHYGDPSVPSPKTPTRDPSITDSVVALSDTRRRLRLFPAFSLMNTRCCDRASQFEKLTISASLHPTGIQLICWIRWPPLMASWPVVMPSVLPCGKCSKKRMITVGGPNISIVIFQEIGAGSKPG